ncbi:MAG: xanthine dehydrogenase family protein subunit M [Desulfobacteraceae bacterium]|nr:xanthine dehydrogenase family protein subunit M [Desulfobacteraceae bacterium]
MIDYEYKKPESLDEVFALLKNCGSQAKLIAGGTDVLIDIKHRKIEPEVLISLRGLNDLQYIRKEDDYHIGAMTTHAMLEHSELVEKELTALQQGAAQVGCVQLRNVATIGGNVCNAAPSADSAAPLLALGARVVLQGPNDRREVEMADFFTGPSATTKKDDEVLVELIIPGDMEKYGSSYCKHSRRKALNLPIIGVAGAIKLNSDNTISDVKIGLTVVAPTPIRALPAEEFLVGKAFTDDVLTEAGKRAAEPDCCMPRDSLRCEGWYREEMVRVLIPRVLKQAAGNL